MRSTAVGLIASLALIAPASRARGQSPSPAMSLDLVEGRGIELAPVSTVYPNSVDAVDLQDQLVPVPADAEIRTVVVTAGTSGGAATGDDPPPDETSRLVYSNTLGRIALGTPPQLPEAILADDVTTLAAEGCPLDRYSVLVTSDLNDDGLSDGPLEVDLALYEACPRAGGLLIPGTEAHVTVPFNGLAAIVVVIAPGADVPIPSSLYIGMSFNRRDAGVVLGAPALVGVSSDRLDHPANACGAGLGGFPIGPHASFNAEIYVREPCTKTFPSYLNTRQRGEGFSPGAGRRFADDIRLGVFPCEMVALEVAGKGSGVVLFDLRTHLVDTDDEFGGLIAGTGGAFLLSRESITFGRLEFDPPISLPAEDLFVSFRTTSSNGGPVVTGRQATVGETADSYLVHDDERWVATDLADPFNTADFDVTITCAGEPPRGACCEMLLPDDDGESVCRDVPEMNCPAPDVWKGGATCESTCIGGDDDGEPCMRQADCPGGDCPGPFEHPCGVAACCTPDDTCENLTHNACLALVAPDEQIVWRRGRFCGDETFRCPFFACNNSDGDCTQTRPTPGCKHPFCCSDICKADPYCCLVEWDRQCVSQIPFLCNIPPTNDECVGSREGHGAREVAANSANIADTRHASRAGSDPAFCCHADGPEAPAFGTVWYKFVATHRSVLLETTSTDSPVPDSLIQVFSVGDPSSDESACNSLIPIACNDDVLDEPETDRSSRLCVKELVPGDTYYVLAAAAHEFVGPYRLTITSPCRDTIPPNDRCVDALEVVTEAHGYFGFDLTGATVECPITECGDALGRDTWYDYVADCTGTLSIGSFTSFCSVPFALAVYKGCACPVEEDSRIACREDPTPEHVCTKVPATTMEVVKDKCYKLRFGARGRSSQGGKVQFDCTPSHSCPVGEIRWVEPPNCVIDARRPHPPDASELTAGINSIVAEAPSGANDPDCWNLLETGAAQPAPANSVEGVADNQDGTFTIHLDRPLTPGAVTTLTYTDEAGTETTGTFLSHPGNVNGDGVADVADVVAMIDILAGAAEAPSGKYSTDCDHSGKTTPLDLLCVIDLLNGAGLFAPGWDGTSLPDGSDICPP